MDALRLIGTLACGALLITSLPTASGAPPRRKVEDDELQWGHYGGDAGGMRHSALTQINRDNVADLEIAWTYRTGELGEGFARADRLAFEATPILAQGSLYLSTPTNIVIALDPATGGFTPRGTATMPCCGSYGLALSDDGILYLTARQAGVVSIAPIDPVTGVRGTTVPIVGPPGFHVEDMRFFEGRLYAVPRNGALAIIDPATGAVTPLPVSLGRFSAMELYP